VRPRVRRHVLDRARPRRVPIRLRLHSGLLVLQIPRDQKRVVAIALKKEERGQKILNVLIPPEKKVTNIEQISSVWLGKPVTESVMRAFNLIKKIHPLDVVFAIIGFFAGLLIASSMTEINVEMPEWVTEVEARHKRLLELDAGRRKKFEDSLEESRKKKFIIEVNE